VRLFLWCLFLLNINMMEEKINEILGYIQNLSHDEVMLLIGITALLILFIVYRRFGLMAFSGLILIYAIAYILYSYDIIGAYNEREKENNDYLKTIQTEIDK